MASKRYKFPKEVLIQHFDDDGGDIFLHAFKDDEDALDSDLGHNTAGAQVGVYRLVDVVRITKKVETKRTKARN